MTQVLINGEEYVRAPCAIALLLRMLNSKRT